ncbi:ABC transporter permease [Kutzneria sp. NPDC052558]|uniref:ABC transporter permease n=1 Tax=Kutzneria sp. NPDC052558 TaxID=3364121 RepID=UPI0037C91A96
MFAYLIRRLIGAVVMLFIVSIAVFLIFFLLPRIGGATADDLASRYVGKTADAAQIHLMAEKLGFTDPLYVQYGRFVSGIFVGADYSTGPTTVHCPAPCLGYSFLQQQPVLPDLLDRFPVTLSLAVGGAIVWLAFGVSAGVISALRKGSVFDRTAMGIALAGVSLPIFFTGLLALNIFSYTLDWFPPGGSYTNFTDNPAEWAYDLVLPWLTLAFLNAAAYARLTRAGMLETMGEDFIRTARAKGLPESTVVVKHGLRAALTPITTIFGLDIGILLGSSILTEKTYSLNGLGQYALQAITQNDLPKVLGVTILAATFVIIANLVVDVLYVVIDPRVRI